MTTINQKHTVYADYIYQTLTIIRQEGGGVFSFLDIAERLGLKPTHNLRKRLRTAEARGILTIGMAYKPERGTFLTYTLEPLPTQLTMFDIPF